LLDYQNSEQMTESPLMVIYLGYQAFLQNLDIIFWILAFPPVLPFKVLPIKTYLVRPTRWVDESA